MSEKQIKPQPAKTPKPEKAKPQTVKPETVKPAKAHTLDGCCVRCEMKPAEFRSLCSDCDLELQTMHYSLEHRLYKKTIYILPGEEPSVEWLQNSKHAPNFSKPWGPKRRPFQQKPAEALSLTG